MIVIFIPAISTADDKIISTQLKKQTAYEIPVKWKSLLQSLINTNSGTDNPEGLNTIRRILIPEFEKLGFQVKTIDTGNKHKLLVIDFPNSIPQLLLIGHIDTVFPKDIKENTMQEIGNKITGPGVIDMKGGIVLMLHALSDIKNQSDLSKIRILINDDEEIGSPFSKSYMKHYADNIPFALVFEPGTPHGDVVIGESGLQWIEIRVHGQSSHAGFAPQDGINACVELAHKLIPISALTDYSKGLSVNVGVIQGGIKPNVVCDQAFAKIDIRFKNENDLKNVLDHISNIGKNSWIWNARLNRGTTYEMKKLVYIQSHSPKASELIFKRAQSVGNEIGLSIKGTEVGYVSDANPLSSLPHLKILVGLGPYGGGMHTENEFLELKSYQDRLLLNISLIKNLVHKLEK